VAKSRPQGGIFVSGSDERFSYLWPMLKLASNWLFTGTELLPDHTVVLDAAGKVQSIEAGIAADAKWKDGLICPAFVNAHCHLELSHLKGQIPRHTGMAGFVRTLQPLRDKFSEDEKLAAMHAAMQEMHQGGIAAIGDICNGRPRFKSNRHIPIFSSTTSSNCLG
jgi:cytosine/adenosine deaminase-related metal-dependent hydrolase